MNDVIELDESSDSDSDTQLQSKSQSSNSIDDAKIDFKKEKTTESETVEDTVMEDENKNKESSSSDLNDTSCINCPNEFTENDCSTSKFDESNGERADDDSDKGNNSENDEDVVSKAADSEENENINQEEEDVSENQQTSEQHDDESDISADSSAPNIQTVTEKENVENGESDLVEQKDDDENKKERNDKENEGECTENKRPPSQESTASTSSSSERITVRSASHINQLVPNSEIKIKVEKDTPEKVEKPGISVLNPTQLGASNNTSGENLLQNNSIQSGEQMIGFLANGLQCDVCETQFSDSNLLNEHRALVGHYKCHFSPECASFVFQTSNEFLSHQQTVHGVVSQSPVQQLAHQVQSIPMRYQMEQGVSISNNFQTVTSFPPGNQPVRTLVPQMLTPTQNNIPLRQYNMSGSLRIGGVRSVMPSQNPLKRGTPAYSPRQIIATKRRYVDIKNGDMDCKFVSVEKPDNDDDVVAQLSKSITITARQETQKKNDTAAVANMLANRGITVSSVSTKQNKSTNPVAMLNLNSAVSLIPTNANNTQTRQNSGFAVPQGRASTNRQSIPGQVSHTVDLTGPDMPRTRQASKSPNPKFTCRICDRPFLNQDQLNQHMVIHRNGQRKQLLYRCTTCSADFSTQHALIQHRQICRKEIVSGTNEMVIPIVDLKQPGALQRLQSFGIHHMIPLNALGSQTTSGTFGIPILAFSSDRTMNTNMANIGISNILPVGPLRRL